MDSRTVEMPKAEAASWKDHVVIITGASSGIGAALAKVFCRQGARVVLAARREDRLDEVARACAGDALPVACDVTRAEDRAHLVDRALAHCGRIDGLVNNAGIGLYGSFDETTEEDLRALFDVNVHALFLLSQAVVPWMRRAGRGLIVNVASTGGLVAHTQGVAAYLATKHAVVGLSRGLRRDLEGSGIRVQVVCPHLTDTEFFGAGVGSERMHAEVESIRHKMDTAMDVAEGTVRALETGDFLVFPTERARTAYERFRDV